MEASETDSTKIQGKTILLEVLAEVLHQEGFRARLNDTLGLDVACDGSVVHEALEKMPQRKRVQPGSPDLYVDPELDHPVICHTFSFYDLRVDATYPLCHRVPLDIVKKVVLECRAKSVKLRRRPLVCDGVLAVIYKYWPPEEARTPPSEEASVLQPLDCMRKLWLHDFILALPAAGISVMSALKPVENGFEMLLELCPIAKQTETREKVRIRGVFMIGDDCRLGCSAISIGEALQSTIYAMDHHAPCCFAATAVLHQMAHIVQ